MNYTCKLNWKNSLVLCATLAAVMLAAGCGSGGKNTLASNQSPAGGPSVSPTPTPGPGPSPSPAPSPTPSPTPGGPPGAQRGKVVVVVEENHGYASVIGNSAMPYLNSLATQYGLATQYYADTHPSIGNYFMMTAGQ